MSNEIDLQQQTDVLRLICIGRCRKATMQGCKSAKTQKVCILARLNRKGYNEMGRIPKDALPLYMPRNHVNGLLAALDLIIHTDEKNEMAVSAQKLKDKILRFGKAFQSNGEDCVSVLLFQNEILPLLKILLLIVSVKVDAVTDYYPIIEHKKKG